MNRRSASLGFPATILVSIFFLAACTPNAAPSPSPSTASATPSTASPLPPIFPTAGTAPKQQTAEAPADKAAAIATASKVFESYLTVLTGYLKNRTLTEDYLAGYVDRNSHLWLSFKEDRLADPNRPYIVSGSWKWTIQATLSEAEDLVPPNVIATIPNGRVIVYGCLDSRGVTYGYPQPGVLKAYHGVLTYHPTERVWFVDTSSYTVPSAMVKKLRC